MENNHFTPHEHHEAKNHNEKKNNFQKLKSEIAKFLAGTSLFATLMMAQPASAQSTDKANTLTEQVEKETTPNYIAQAPQKLQEFYPQYTEHFNKIFEVVRNTDPEVLRVINQKLQESLQNYSIDIATEKDKRTMILMFMELAYPDTKFTKENEQLDEDGLDMRQIGANEALQELNRHFKKKVEKAKEENARAKEQLKKTQEENARAKEQLKKTQEENARARQKREETKANLAKIKARGQETQKRMEEALQGLERIIKELSPELVKTNPQAQEVIHYYYTFCKENGFTPIPQAQKFMDLLAKN